MVDGGGGGGGGGGGVANLPFGLLHNMWSYALTKDLHMEMLGMVAKSTFLMHHIRYLPPVAPSGSSAPPTPPPPPPFIKS